MRKTDILLILLVPLWGLGSFYITVSHEDHNASPLGLKWLFPPNGLSHETHWLLGYTMFLVSFVVIFAWTSLRK